MPGAFIERSAGFELGADDVGADQPVGLAGGLPEVVLLDQRAEDVGDRLVQRAGLAGVGEVGLVLRHAVGQLVADTSMPLVVSVSVWPSPSPKNMWPWPSQ